MKESEREKERKRVSVRRVREESEEERKQQAIRARERIVHIGGRHSSSLMHISVASEQ